MKKGSIEIMSDKMSPEEIAKWLDRIDQLEGMSPAYIGSKEMYALHQAQSILCKITVGKLKPVVQAHWIEKTTPWNMGCTKYFVCSNCDAKQANTYEENGNKYCDVCGASMGEKLL